MTYRIHARAEAMVRVTEGLAARLARVALRREVRSVVGRALLAAAAAETALAAAITARFGAHALLGPIAALLFAGAFVLARRWAVRAEEARASALLRRVSDVARAAVAIPKAPLHEALAVVRSRRDEGLVALATAGFVSLPLVLLLAITPVTGVRLAIAVLFFAMPPLMFFVWVGRRRGEAHPGTELLGLVTILGYAAFGLLGFFDTSALVIATIFLASLGAPIALRIAADRAIQQEAHDLAMLDASIDFAALTNAADVVAEALGVPPAP